MGNLTALDRSTRKKTSPEIHLLALPVIMKKHFLFLALLLLAHSAFTQKPETPAERTQRMAWWKEAKFGLFIHWGLYAVAAGEYKGQHGYGEWLMYEARIPKPEYEKFAGQFNPVRFDAESWVLLAKNAGMKYIVITAKHHDGFCMFDSKVSDYDIIDRTPFGRDPLRELADACRRHGLKLCFYHSIMDWHHPHENKTDFARYRDEYLLPQLKELLTNYGDIGVLWFDGEWIEEWTEEQGNALYRYVRELQPNIIVNNRVGKGRNGMQGMNNSEDAAGDFGTPEQEILGGKSELDWESCMTMNDHWGYNKNDKNFKSAEDLIWNLVDINAKGGNYLLNVGPTAEGLFPPESIERLNAIGEWMAVNSEAVHGAKTWVHWQEGENIRYAEGKNGAVYVFLRGKTARELTLKKIRPDAGSAITLLGNDKDLSWRQTPDGAVIRLPEADTDRIRVLRMQGQPENVTPPPHIGTGTDGKRKAAVFAQTEEIEISAAPGAEIYYTTDGSEPNSGSKRYSGKFAITNSTTVRAIARAPGQRSSETVQMQYIKARYGIRVESAYAEKYAAQGPLSLVDGVEGSKRFTDGNWLGFEGVDFSAVLDLGAKKSLRSVSMSFLRVIPSWIFLPRKLEVWGSDDGEHFTLLAEDRIPAAKDGEPNGRLEYRLRLSAQTRYLRLVAKNQGICPSWHPGAGGKSWVFVDEVSVEEQPGPASPAPRYDLLPTPVELTPEAGFFVLSGKTVFREHKSYPSFFRKYLREKQGIAAVSGKPAKSGPVIVYELNQSALEPEAYRLDISGNRIRIEAGGPAGFFYADQTLIQLLEANSGDGGPKRLPCARINDAPRFAWRGMHLDESRHFFGKAFVKQYLDYLAGLKMNVFHWHLTDAPGWRIEIKKYPKLTSVGAWRPDRSGVLFSDADTARTGEPMPYGGFYTQEDIREILAYAAERHITVVPEIEMPGHTTAALVAYPEYSCTGGPFPMPGGAKNCPYPNYCVGNDSTIQFLCDILSEVIALFPSAYIHIGGDEVDRAQWQSCSRCQQRKAALGLSDEAQLQVDFTKRIEDFIRSKGRRLMGWDEIMEGGNLTPSAGVMVWRGENLVREATAAGHEVIVTHNYYFDLYQGNPQYEPVTYGYKPLPEVYRYEPVPADLTPAQAQLVRGVEGCLWSENIYDTRHAEYMLLPRLLALAEVAWTPAARKNWDDFSRRLPAYLDRLAAQGVNFATSIYNPYPEVRYDSTTRSLTCRFEQQIPAGDIHYTTDGSAPTPDAPVYYDPLPLSKPAEIRATVFKAGKPISKTVALAYRPSLASGKPFSLKYRPGEKYNGRRPEALTDGLFGSEAFHDGNWCGFYGDDFDLSIDLGSEQALKSVRMNWLEANNSWIYLPVTLSVALSADGQTYDTIYTASAADIAALSSGRIKAADVPLNGKKARYVRIYAQNPGQHPVYPDGKCWLFIDEVQVNGAGD